jgi:BirA family transcriptional regulator, biotin operon repressor / biotin---[acetyl-CoA-carboxylase] ligase
MDSTFATQLKATTWDSFSAQALADRCGVRHLELLMETDSTQDVAHTLAESGAPGGTLVLAESQRAGRGRQGRSWRSEPGIGVWCTLIERPATTSALDVLSLRVGLYCADALDVFAGARIGVKWPNDLVVLSEAGNHALGKLGGILVETRWAGSNLAWIAIGVGINVVAPVGVPGAAGLTRAVRRVNVLEAIVGAVRSAASTHGPFSDGELAQYRARDVLAGRRITAPAEGVVSGITAAGTLIVDTARGREEFRAGTVRLETGDFA